MNEQSEDRVDSFLHQSLVRPEGRAASDVPQDVRPETILAMLEQVYDESQASGVMLGYSSYRVGVLDGIEIAINKLRELMDANSEPPA